MNVFHVPLFVEAETKQELVQEMIRNNAKDRVTYKYFSIVFDGKTWSGWYYGDATLLVKQSLPKTETTVVRPTIGRTKKIT